MTQGIESDHRIEQLTTMVTEAVRLADELALMPVAVRLEQARILLLNQPD